MWLSAVAQGVVVICTTLSIGVGMLILANKVDAALSMDIEDTSVSPGLTETDRILRAQSLLVALDDVLPPPTIPPQQQQQQTLGHCPKDTEDHAHATKV